jgi:hypothetical protein
MFSSSSTTRILAWGTLFMAAILYVTRILS